jgi:hypothetical protein
MRNGILTTKQSSRACCIIATCILSLNHFTAKAADQSVPDPLGVAHKLANEKYRDWTYGEDPSKKQINCVQFVLAVVQKIIPSLPDSAKTRILISDLSAADVESNANGIITSGNSKTKGVQQALIDINRGTEVALTDAKAGDLIQYWMQKSDGTWFGHSGVIEAVDDTGGVRRATIFGASQSLKKIGSSPADKRLILKADPKRRIYIVRIKAA